MLKVVLLVNLGTPKSPRVLDVARYLHQFLSDQRVIDIPWLIRKALLYCLILPFRSFRSARAYQQIWQASGSPLMSNSLALTQELQAQLNVQEYSVYLAMRYGTPAIGDVIKEILSQSVSELIIIPLFPQYSSAASGSALASCLQELAQYPVIPQLKIINNWHASVAYIQALAHSIRSYYNNQSSAHIIFSFHGLPLRQVQKVCSKICSADFSCCRINAELAATSTGNLECYRAQCSRTAQLVASELCLDAKNWTLAFQSRLGRIEWLQPYLTEHLNELFVQGVRELCVISPGFVCDCLETLEELGMQLQEQWFALGGSSFKLIPCLNVDGAQVLLPLILETS